MSEKFSMPKLDKPQIMQILKIALVLLIITALTSLALSFVNEITREQIAENELKSVEAAMNTVLPASKYEKIEYTGEDKLIREIFSADDGYCVKVAPTGFGGEILMIVGIDASNAVTGVSIISMSETPGLGTKTNSEDFLSQFVGKKSARLTKDKGEAAAVSGATEASTAKNENGEIVAVTGATVSSRAVTSGVAAALSAVSAIKGGAQNAA